MKREFTRMESWQKAHDLTLEVYELARKLPEEEQELMLQDRLRILGIEILRGPRRGRIPLAGHQQQAEESERLHWGLV